jgi:hypothetical protein
MKQLITLTLLLFCLHSVAQPHVSAPPPLNPGYPLIRSLVVDCTGRIIDDMVNGNPALLEANLLNYLSDNYITYAVLYDLENAGIFGNTQRESSFLQLIHDLHMAGVQAGVSCSMNSFQNSPLLPSVPLNLDKHCFSSNIINNTESLNKIFSQPAVTPGDKAMKATVTFFFQLVRMIRNSGYSDNDPECIYSIDALYLDYPYWNTTSTMQAMQDDFSNFKKILSVMQLLKCNNGCIRFIDAEFLPTDMFKLQGWTSIDQITEADTLIDRVVIPSNTNIYQSVFDVRCKLMHYLSDPFGKTGTRMLIKNSVESTAFGFCNSPAIPGNYLGDYLNGTAFPSGNMYSVEKTFLDKFNDANYMCPSCHCYGYADNHYASANIRANILSGFVWTPYSMMQNHHLFRNGNPATGNPENANSIYELYKPDGSHAGTFNSTGLGKFVETISDGIYLLLEKANGKISKTKLFIHRQ